MPQGGYYQNYVQYMSQTEILIENQDHDKTEHTNGIRNIQHNVFIISTSTLDLCFLVVESKK